MKLLRVFSLALLWLFIVPQLALAQDSYWGLSASFTPSWKANDRFKVLFQADELDLSGSEFRVGVVRGRTLGGDWGLSLVRKSLKDGGVVDGENGRYVLGSDVTLLGGTIDKFAVFGTIKDRVQIGMLLGIGAAQIKGAAVLEGTGPVAAKEALGFAGRDIKFSPLARLELAVAVIVVEGFKIRASGGLSYPGLSTFSIGGVYLFER
jgi:hypothetical protein